MISKLLQPKSLKIGETIGICAPSGTFNKTEFNQGLNIIKKMGFKIYIPKGLNKKKRYFAGSDIHRANIINHLFSNNDIKAIICAKGGFGAIRILPFLDYNIIRNNPKLFVGFSDITSLLSVFENKCFFQVIHGPVITSLGENSSTTLKSFFNILTSFSSKVTFENDIILYKGNAQGILSGGNLTTICHLMGTNFQPGFKEKILFLEETREAPYRIDRMLTQMKMAGAFNGIKGVVAGSFNDCGDINMIFEILLEIFHEFQIPVLAGLDAGHGKTNLCLPLGKMVRLDSNNLIC
ncbi:MAG: hypothetical protein B6I26_00190 [Desulfobacteraceae bacterium 4572_130]|nr:MAG: hypothetical protein B6I26_00190 [Desulfobacteraceae bacterium 4572_130]